MVTAAHQIITKGIGGGPACSGLITTGLSLVFFDIEIEYEAPNSGGGPYPENMGAWNQVSDVGNFYTPTAEQPYVIPPNQEADYFRQHKNVTIKVTFNGHTNETIYRIHENKLRILVKVVNFINITKSKINITAGNIKRIAHRIKVFAKLTRNYIKK